jgi:hypothetical protein
MLTSGSAISPRFVESPAAMTLAGTAQRFGQRPSSLLGLRDPVVALALDQALAVRLAIDEDRRAREARSGKPGMLPDGMRYETEGEILSAVEPALLN